MQIANEAMDIELDKDTVTKAYARWAPVYDLVFGPVFERGRRAAIEAAERVGGRILEVGVGTGISLPDYSPANRVCRRRHLRADAAQGAGAGRRARPDQCRGARGHGRRAPGLSRRLVRRRGRAIRRHHGARPRRRSTSSPACSGPAARSCCSAASARKPGCGARSSTGSRRWRAARLAHRIPLGALRALGATGARRAPDRAPRRCRRSAISR